MTKIRKRVLVLGTLVGLAISAVIGGWAYAVSNVEQPKYVTVEQDGLIEIRDYPSLIVAEVTRRGDRGAAVRQGFSPLAQYIFAKDRGGESVSMTAPVMQERQAIEMTAPVTLPQVNAVDSNWTVRFIMPAKYTLATLPKPGSNDVHIAEVPAMRRAAIRFSGIATDGSIAANQQILSAWLKSRNLTPLGEPTFAYYNDPFTPGALRRNEVMFDIKTAP